MILKKSQYDIYPLYTIREVADKAKTIVSLNVQAGEAWTIAGDMSMLAESNVHNIVCFQPFGCLATHVAGKGVRRRMERAYPQLKMLFLDIDPGDSKVNIFNRIQIFLQSQHTQTQRIN